MKVFSSVAEVKEFVGGELGPSEWTRITQEMVNRFGEVTGSDDWIHTDPVRAASGPFGQAIAQGDLLLSLIPRVLHGLYRLDGQYIGMIYGSNKIRLPSSAPVGARIRVRGKVSDVSDRGGDTLLTLQVAVEVEGSERPAVAAEVIHLYRPAHA